MTSKRQREIEEYRRRVRELRAEQSWLAGGKGVQQELEIPLAEVIDIRSRRVRRGWVQP